MVWFSKRTLLLVMDVMPQGIWGRCSKWSEEVRYCCSLYANRNLQTKMIDLPANRFVVVLPVYFKASELQLTLSASYISFCQSFGRGWDTVLNFVTHGRPLHITRYTTRVCCVWRCECIKKYLCSYYHTYIFALSICVNICNMHCGLYAYEINRLTMFGNTRIENMEEAG